MSLIWPRSGTFGVEERPSGKQERLRGGLEAFQLLPADRLGVVLSSVARNPGAIDRDNRRALVSAEDAAGLGDGQGVGTTSIRHPLPGRGKNGTQGIAGGVIEENKARLGMKTSHGG